MRSRLLALCLGNFVIGTGTLIVSGMLPSIATGLNVGIPVAAQLVTAFAFTVCVTAPPLASLTSRFARGKLLVSVQLLFAAGHLASVFVSSFEQLLVLRVLSSVGAALFTAQAAITAGLVAPPEKRGSAVAFVFLGWSLASVLGMPLGAYIGETFGWRVGFALVGVGALLMAAVLRMTIPAQLHVAPIDLRMWQGLLRHPLLMSIVCVTAIQAAAQFTVLSFLVPMMKLVHDASATQISGLLALFGATGVIGNLVGARLVDRLGSARVVMVTLLFMLASHLVWPFAATSLHMLSLCLVFWGIGSFACNSAQQARLVLASQDYAAVSVALNSSAIYLGQAFGTAVGASMISPAGDSGYALLSAISVPLFLLAIGTSVFAQRRMRA